MDAYIVQILFIVLIFIKEIYATTHDYTVQRVLSSL